MALVYFLLDFVRFLCYLLSMLIIVRAVLSWFSPRPTNVLMVYLYRITEPLLAPLRRIIPRTDMVDLSPLLAIVLLQVTARILGVLY
ncbi:YggT family protein [Chloroflexota bacterium]